MADAQKIDDSDEKSSAKPVIPRTALEIQKMQYDKLMRDPVSGDILLKAVKPERLDVVSR